MYLDAKDKSRDAAAYMLSKFLTRPDVRKEKLPAFLDWCLIRMKNINGTVVIILVLQSIRMIGYWYCSPSRSWYCSPSGSWYCSFQDLSVVVPKILVFIKIFVNIEVFWDLSILVPQDLSS